MGPAAHPEVPIDTRAGFLGTIGNTPLIRLARLSDETGCEILAKAEFLNPGGSVKDRAALWIIRDAEAKGTLRPGGTVVEYTAGTTGISLAFVCAARGYALEIVFSDAATRGGTLVSSLRSEPKSFNRIVDRQVPTDLYSIAPAKGGTCGNRACPVRKRVISTSGFTPSCSLR